MRGTPPDYGPPALHPAAGATLVSARPPLIAFNLELEPPATLEDARRIAALIRAGGELGLPGVRALGLHLERRDVVQVSTNIEDHRAVTAAAVLAAVARHHAVRGGRARRAGARRPRSPAGRRTSICACRRRSRRSWSANVSGPWPRPSASAVPSTGATPPAPSRPAAARAASPTPGDQRKRGGAREDRRFAEPTWGGAAMRAGLASVMLFVLFISGIAGSDQTIATAILLSVAAFLIYVPLGYKVDRMFWERRMRKAGRPLPPKAARKR